MGADGIFYDDQAGTRQGEGHSPALLNTAHDSVDPASVPPISRCLGGAARQWQAPVNLENQT